jgi:hypothetical protein
MIKINLTNEIYSKQKTQYARPADKTLIEYISHWFYNGKYTNTNPATEFMYGEGRQKMQLIDNWKHRYSILRRITQILKPKGE